MSNSSRVIFICLIVFLLYNHFTKPYEMYRVWILAFLAGTLSISLLGWDKEVENV
jgi:uncharacterized membrane protein YobD (UPF0266 family)